MTRRIAVTGSASGIGKALVELLRAQGDTVIGVDRETADIRADLSTEDGRARAVAELGAGPLDGVVACAGVSAPEPISVSVNHFGVVRLLEGLRPVLAAAPNPRAAVVGSIAGTQPVDQAVVDACLRDDEPAALELARAAVANGAGHRLYPSSKSALAQWLRRAAVTEEWAGAGIPLNAVAPGVVLSPMVAPLIADEAMKEVMDRAVPMPLNGYARPAVIATALNWLISPGNTHMTGQVIYVDGGADATLRGPGVF
ncbi:NAD(P)-dependent dehydrogenase, short-chain alcohol dehydrogenase family [Saccharopolyspora kobensis]|uniref:NAD(P)-dependent dehydrogenase, short-chain alcohol dehydrogenase family n=1 Tax=Saccharopolyspora kobensis TaxID=146035 RepID=A0A1H5SSG3_9PSEU|nr:SDR family oxidoreductase [Saccharopolyspora kobensis]SEF53519.1 NAD(P)-dependent dehydrogenase, short-chain alcohol dehydrogenase family [Saccharopolyspora kobensis]SFC53913.1 NAD(P)-dependent dehydrogenase, short-chain alcohol dehydrogenase family [Saccharopolyspora kobensis]